MKKLMLKQYNKSKLFLCFFLILFILFWIFLIEFDHINYIDEEIYGFISKMHSNSMTVTMKVITSLSGTFAIIFLLALSYLFLKNKKYAHLMTINIINVVLLNQILKNIFRRTRPLFINIIEEAGYSFPSGHAMASFGFYGFIIFLIHRSNMSNRYKIILTIMLTILIILVGISRIYLGVHFFSDIVGGYVVSAIYLLIYTHFVKKYLNDV